MGWKIMAFLETVEKNKENFLKEEKKRYNKKIVLETKCLKEYWDSLSIEEKKEYENDNAWYPFLINFMEDKLGITFEDYEPTLEDYKSLLL